MRSCDCWYSAVECGGGVGSGEEEEECVWRHGAKLQLALLARRKRAPMRYSHNRNAQNSRSLGSQSRLTWTRNPFCIFAARKQLSVQKFRRTEQMPSSCADGSV